MFRNSVICLILAFLTAASASAKSIYGDRNTYAAIAYSPVTGKFAYSYNHYTRKGAEEEALKKCKAEGIPARSLGSRWILCAGDRPEQGVGDRLEVWRGSH